MPAAIRWIGKFENKVAVNNIIGSDGSLKLDDNAWGFGANLGLFYEVNRGTLRERRRYECRPSRTSSRRDAPHENAVGDGQSVPSRRAGPLFDTRDIKDGYHGYRFRILEAQGPAASGGARSYLTRGRLANGFALVAWPARHGDTGVMSFLSSHDGIVHQKNLGAAAAVASAMTRFDPDATWTPLLPP